MSDKNPVVDAIKEGVHLRKVDAPPERKLPTAEELAEAKRLAAENPEPPAKEDLPHTGSGKTHLDLLKEGEGPKLKPVQTKVAAHIPTAEELAEAKRLAEENPEPPAKEDLPHTGSGKTHLDLLKEGAPALKKVAPPPERPLPTKEQIEEEKKAEGK